MTNLLETKIFVEKNVFKRKDCFIITKETVYVASELMDWRDNTTAEVIGIYQTSEAAKKAADERINEVVDAYSEDDFPRESLDISNWNDESEDEQVKEIYADEDRGAWVTGLVYQVKINHMTLKD